MSRIIAGVAVAASLLCVPLARADTCDGLTGQALGLCTAGVAVGCEEGTGNAQACSRLENAFRDATGEEPPWLASCPCDFSQLSLALASNRGPWPDTGFYSFTCDELVEESPTTRNGVFSGANGPVKAKLAYEVFYTDDLPSSGKCGVSEGGTVLQDISFPVGEILSLGRACRGDLIAYGHAFMALHPEVVFDILECAE